LWGAAALALAAGATAYALTRRREREAEHEAELERKREQAAEWAAKAAAPKARVEANKQAARSTAVVVAVAAAAAAADVARLLADRRVERLEERLHAQEVQAQERARLEAARQAEEAARAAALAQAERLRAIGEARDQIDSDTTMPPPAAPPEALFGWIPSFSAIERDDERPVISLGVYEAGIRTVFHAGGRLSPNLRVTPARLSFSIGGMLVNVGWQANTIEFGLRTPEERVLLDDRGTVLTRRQVGWAVLQWNGWNTTLGARYNYLDYAVAGPGQATWYGAGSQGIYLRERVLQVATGLLAAVAIAGATLLFAPQVAQQITDALGRMGGPIPIPGN
jgi:hypothetical protein